MKNVESKGLNLGNAHSQAAAVSEHQVNAVSKMPEIVKHTCFVNK